MSVKTILSSFSGQIFATLVGLAIVSACTLDTKTQANTGLSLKHSTWQLKTLDGNAVVSERPLTLNFDDSRLNGYSGCNSFFGSYVGSNDGVFSTGAIGATKMACGGERDQIEQHFLKQLSQAKQFALSREQLHLLDENRKILLTFNATKPTQTSTTP